MIFRPENPGEGEPARLYRSPEEIAEEIGRLRAEAEEINERVNVRAVLLDLLTSREKTAEGWAFEIRLAVCENQKSLVALRELEERLDLLSRELADTERMLAGYAPGRAIYT